MCHFIIFLLYQTYTFVLLRIIILPWNIACHVSKKNVIFCRYPTPILMQLKIKTILKYFKTVLHKKFKYSPINIISFINYKGLLLFPTLNGVGTTCFSSCCDRDSAITFTAGRLSDVNLP
jgi:hypothetical protein